MRRGLPANLAALTFVLVSGRANAQQSASSGAALKLFDDGVRLMDQGKYAEACPLLARSQEVSPNGGTIFALADCYEKNGQNASAWASYKEAATRARAADKPDAERRALDTVQALAPKVTWLKLTVADAQAPGLAVSRDGQDVARAEWGVAVPLDPGTHKIEAHARGRKPWSSEVRVSTTGAQLAVDVPKLDVEGEPSHDADVSSASGWSTQRYVGLGIAGVGVAGVVVGTIFGLRSSSKNDEAATHCVSETFCDDAGLRLDSEGRDAGAVSTVAFIVGAAALAGGAILFFTAPPGRAASGANGRGLRVGGSGVPAVGGSGGSFALRMTGSF